MSRLSLVRHGTLGPRSPVKLVYVAAAPLIESPLEKSESTLHFARISGKRQVCLFDLPDATNNWLDMASETWPGVWLGRGLGVDNHRRYRGAGPHHHAGAAPAHKWLVRPILRDFRMSTHSVAPEKIRRHQTLGMGAFRHRLSHYCARTPVSEDRRARVVPSSLDMITYFSDQRQFPRTERGRLGVLRQWRSRERTT
jgi:hypothetical protein